MIATDSESDDLSREATRTMSQEPQGQHHQHDLATTSLDTDSDLALWLQHTGFFDIEHRHKVLGALRKLKDIDEQRCKIVSEVRSSTDYYLVSPTPQRSTALASLSSSSLAAQKTRQSAVYDYIDSRSAAFAGSNERCGSEISSLTRGAGSDNGYMTFGNRPVSRQEPDAAPSSIASTQQNPQPSVEATTSPVDPNHVSPEAESSPPVLRWGQPFDAVPRRLGKGKSVNKYPLAQILSSVPKQDSRYFLVKSFNVSNVEKSQRDGLWITKAKNGTLFANAFKQHKNVYLIFSINKSKAFQGYARMTSPPNANIPPANWMGNIAWEASSPFRVEWLNTRSTEFWKLGDLKNPLNDGSPVFVGRDGQEYPEACGRKMTRILDRVDRGTRERRDRAAESSPRKERRQTCDDRGKLEEEDGGEVKEEASPWKGEASPWKGEASPWKGEASPWRRDEVSQNGDAASASTADDLLLLEY